MPARDLVWWANAFGVDDNEQVTLHWDYPGRQADFTRHGTVIPYPYGCNWWITEDGEWHGADFDPSGAGGTVGLGIPYADDSHDDYAIPTTHPVDGDGVCMRGYVTVASAGLIDFFGPNTFPATVLTLSKYDASDWVETWPGSGPITLTWGAQEDGLRGGTANLAIAPGGVLRLPLDKHPELLNTAAGRFLIACTAWDGDASQAGTPSTLYVGSVSFGKMPPGSTVVSREAFPGGMFVGSMNGGTVAGTANVANPQSLGFQAGSLMGDILWNTTGKCGAYLSDFAAMLPAVLTDCTLRVASGITLSVDRTAGTYGVGGTNSRVIFGAPWARLIERLQPDNVASTYKGVGLWSSQLAQAFPISRNRWDMLVMPTW